MVFAVRFALNRSSPPVRNATHLRTFCFLEVIFAPGEILVNQRVLSAARFTLKTALNYHEQCHEFADLLFYRPSFWIIFSFRETLGFFSCATHSLDLCILFKLIFYTSGYIPPHSCAFYTFCLQQLFHMYSTMRNIFLFLHDALDWRKSGI